MTSIEFKALSPEKAENLRSLSHYRRFNRGGMVFLQGDSYLGPFIVAEGQFKVYLAGDDGKESVLNIFRTDDLLASGPLFLGGGYPASCSAVTDGCLICFEYDRLLKLLKADEAINGYFLQRSIHLIPRLKEKIENLTLKNAEQRMIAYLKSLGADKQAVALEIPKHQIAALLDLSPESVSRVLGKLAAREILSVEGKTYKLNKLG